jgi:hypothetical protein
MSFGISETTSRYMNTFIKFSLLCAAVLVVAIYVLEFLPLQLKEAQTKALKEAKFECPEACCAGKFPRPTLQHSSL